MFHKEEFVQAVAFPVLKSGAYIRTKKIYNLIWMKLYVFNFWTIRRQLAAFSETVGTCSKFVSPPSEVYWRDFNFDPQSEIKCTWTAFFWSSSQCGKECVHAYEMRRRAKALLSLSTNKTQWKEMRGRHKVPFSIISTSFHSPHQTFDK